MDVIDVPVPSSSGEDSASHETVAFATPQCPKKRMDLQVSFGNVIVFVIDFIYNAIRRPVTLVMICHLSTPVITRYLHLVVQRLLQG